MASQGLPIMFMNFPKTHKVVPHSLLSWFITPITMVYARYIFTIPMVYKPTFTSLGGHHLAVVNHRFPQSYSHLMPIEAQLQDHLLMLSDPLRNLFGDSGHVMRIVNCCVQQDIGTISCSKQHALSRANLRFIIWKMSDVR